MPYIVSTKDTQEYVVEYNLNQVVLSNKRERAYLFDKTSWFFGLIKTGKYKYEKVDSK